MNWLLGAILPFLLIGLLAARRSLTYGLSVLLLPLVVWPVIGLGLREGWWGHSTFAESLTKGIVALAFVSFLSTGVGATVGFLLARQPD